MTYFLFNVVRGQMNSLQGILENPDTPRAEWERAYARYGVLSDTLYEDVWIPEEGKTLLFLRKEWMPFAK